LKAEEKTEVIIILVVILIGKQGIIKRVSIIILKEKRESLSKINFERMKIIGGKELEREKSAGSAGRRGISDRSVQANRKTRNSRSLWDELG